MIDMGDDQVVVGAGTLRSLGVDVMQWPHRWTPGGVTVEADFTGAQLLHLATAACILNDIYREASRLSVPVDGVRVTAGGGLSTDIWRSTAVRYAVEVDTTAPHDDIEVLLKVVDVVAEIPRALRSGMSVERAG
jgi:hypothetical protein